MSCESEIRAIEHQLQELEKKTGYTITQEEPGVWRNMAQWLGSTYVIWGSHSGYLPETTRHTLNAGPCFAGVAFRREGNIYVPDIFHFYASTLERDILLYLQAPAGVGVWGLVGSKRKDAHNYTDTAYTKRLHFAPILSPQGKEFNVLVVPASRQVIYMFD
jgi:hypothetical protein